MSVTSARTVMDHSLVRTTHVQDGGRNPAVIIRGLLANSLETAALGEDGFYEVGTGPGSTEAKYVDWLTLSDNAQSVAEDVTRIRSHPLVPPTIPIYGYLYDVSTGRLVEVPGATKTGAVG